MRKNLSDVPFLFSKRIREPIEFLPLPLRAEMSWKHLGMIISFRLIIDTLVRWKVRDAFDHFSSLSIPRPVPLFLSLAGSSRVGRVRSSRCGVDDESPYRVPLPRSSILRNHPHARPLSVCRSAPVRSGTLFCNIVLLQPQRCVSSLREILTRIEYKKIYNARSIIMKQAGASSPRFT